MMETRQVVVHGNFIRSIRANTRMNVAQQMAEIIDNAIDARAKKIAVTFDKESNSISIVDDGIGCADLSRFAEFGNAQDENSGSRVGRYGVGGKQASILLCDEERITSICSGIQRKAIIPWGKMSTQTGMDWHKLPEKQGLSNDGTAIELRGILRPSAFAPQMIDKCKRYWQQIYLPSLKSGLVLKVNETALKPLSHPALIDRRVLEGTFQGKKYIGVVGILEHQDEKYWEPGWYVSCAGRLMNDRGLLDSFGEWPGAQVWGYFQLIESVRTPRWHLDTNKLDFAEREEFFAHIVPQIEDLMRLGQQRGVLVETGLIEDDASEALAAIFGGIAYKREKRDSPKNNTGSVHPIETARKRRTAEKINPDHSGSVEDVQKSMNWKLQFRNLGANNEICKPSITGKACWIDMNLDNNFISERRQRIDTMIGIAAPALWASASDKEQKYLWTLVSEDEFEMEALSIDKRALRWVAKVLSRYSDHASQKKRKSA